VTDEENTKNPTQEDQQNKEGDMTEARPAITAEQVIPQFVESEMKSSYIDYAMSVIVGRALPDVRDGLKPVHRRILYSMYTGGHTSSKPYTKSARIVGDVLGKYHPHGDMAVYDALVRMAQDFSLRYPLIDGQGNFGSVDGDSAAAMRYTESRLKKIAEDILEDIEKETVDFIPNYDGSLKEPTVLPAKVPNQLINGSSGIAVGMATNIPPHSLGEVVDGIIYLIENPDATTVDMMRIVPGPDFPTGGIICGTGGIYSAYSTGKGKIRIRARTEMEESDKGRKRIIVTELPYQVNKSKLLEDIAEAVKEKRIEGIADLRDESDKDGMRVVFELKRDSVDEVVLNQLFKHSALQTTFGIINLALVDGIPKELSLKETMQHFIAHRFEIITNRIKYDLKKARERAHILEGLIIALDNIDECIAIIKKSPSAAEAGQNLILRFSITEIQAKAILEMRLQKLTGLEMKAIKDEHARLMELINELTEILGSDERIYSIIKDELRELKEKYGDERRTEITEDVDDLEYEDLIPREQMVVTITSKGYIRRIPLEEYKAQHRGGKGLIGVKTVEEDFPVDIFVSWSHDYLLFFSNKGQVYWLKTYRVPVGGRYAKGRAIVNLLPNLDEGELINAIIPISEFDDDHFLIFATRNGIIKKTALSAYSRPRANGIRAILLREGDELIKTTLSDGSMYVMLATKMGQAIRFHENDVRSMGRVSTGVIGIRMGGDDEVVSMLTVQDNARILSITENGFGKRTMVDAYREIRRGGKGVRTIKVNERNGSVVCLLDAEDDDEMVVTTMFGMVIRIPVSQVSVQGRDTMGVRIIRLNEGDKVTGIAKVKKEEEEDNDGDENGGDGGDTKDDRSGENRDETKDEDDSFDEAKEAGVEDGPREEDGET